MYCLLFEVEGQFYIKSVFTSAVFEGLFFKGSSKALPSIVNLVESNSNAIAHLPLECICELFLHYISPSSSLTTAGSAITSSEKLNAVGYFFSHDYSINEGEGRGKEVGEKMTTCLAFKETARIHGGDGLPTNGPE